MMPTNFKAVIGYLSTLQGSSALYGKNFELYWTNDNEFFDGFDLSPLQDILPIREETYFSQTAHGEKKVLTVTPIIKGKYAACGYAFNLKNSYQVYKMAEKTEVGGVVNKVIDHYSNNAQKLKELNENARADILLKKSLASAEANIGNQGRYISMLTNEIEAVRLLFIDEKKEENSDITTLVTILFNQLSEYYKNIQRKINFSLNEKDFYYVMDYNLMSLAFLQVVKFHTCTSPLKASLVINGDYCANDKGFYGITVKSKKSPEKGENDDGLGEFYRNLAKKIFLFDLKGGFVIEDTDKFNITTVKFPAFKKNRGSIFALNNIGYLSENFKPCNIVLKEQVNREIQILERIKMEKATKKKLELQDD